MSAKVNSKAKGARFERYLAGILKSFGFDCKRTAQYCGNTGDAADVVGLPGIHIEAKHQEQTRLYDWMAQAEHDAGLNEDKPIPVVMHKRNNHSVLVTMELEDWIEIYREFYENRREKEYKNEKNI